MKKKKDLSRKTQDIIHECAIAEFIENGYHGARMQRIADRAGVNKAMLFYYFTSKEEIYQSVLKTVFAAIFGNLSRITDEPVPLEEKIGQIFDVYFTVIRRNPDYLKLVLFELMRGGENLTNLLSNVNLPFDPATGSLPRYFKRKMDEGEMRRIDPLQLFISIVGQTLMPFIGRPLLEKLGGRAIKNFSFDAFIAARRDFVVQLVCDGIRVKR